MDKELLRTIVQQYGFRGEQISEPIDSSHGEEDRRLVYIVDDTAVLHCYSAAVMDEAFLQGISRLVQRHKEIAVWAPSLFPRKDMGELLTLCREGETLWRCYMEEKAPYAFLDKKKIDLYDSKAEMLPFLGTLASRYSNIDLVENRSMWSIIELAPMDAMETGIDEKQENVDSLCAALGEQPIVQRIRRLNERARSRIGEHLAELPRCVYQGDLNPSNVLVDEEQHFRGVIDFNLYGTDVNINCFLNESMYYVKDEDVETLNPAELLNKMRQVQKRLMDCILQQYSLNPLEQSLLEEYRFAIELGFYPNVSLLKKLLSDGKTDYVLEFLTRLCDQYE